jgi:rhodanese-related sulfurtransferase
MKTSKCVALFLVCVSGGFVSSSNADARDGGLSGLALDSVSEQPGSGVPEVTTTELEQILKDQSALVLDTRPHAEWSISHIPNAKNVAPKPGVPMALYTSDVSEVGRMVNGNKSQPLVLYCNGPFCGKSKRVAGELLEAGYTNVRRYQLGAPVWRALIGVMVIEPDGAQYVFQHDRTAVWIDVRERSAFEKGSIPTAKNVPRSLVLSGKDVGEVFAAKNDGRLPMKDHNTRIIVYGQNGEQARDVAEALAREAFHNVTYFGASYEVLRNTLGQ